MLQRTRNTAAAIVHSGSKLFLQARGRMCRTRVPVSSVPHPRPVPLRPVLVRGVPVTCPAGCARIPGGCQQQRRACFPRRGRAARSAVPLQCGGGWFRSQQGSLQLAGLYDGSCWPRVGAGIVEEGWFRVPTRCFSSMGCSSRNLRPVSKGASARASSGLILAPSRAPVACPLCPTPCLRRCGPYGASLHIVGDLPVA